MLHVVPDEESQEMPQGALMSVILRNASKSGTDEIIARALLPLAFLMDQKKHSFWLKFHPPTGQTQTDDRGGAGVTLSSSDSSPQPFSLLPSLFSKSRSHKSMLDQSPGSRINVRFVLMRD
jgi:hypothetical protein